MYFCPQLVPILWMVDRIGDHPHWTLNPSSDTMMSSHPRCSHPEEAAEAKYPRSSKEEDLAKNMLLQLPISYLPAPDVHPFKRAMHFTFYSKTSTPRAFPRLLLIASLITGTLSQDCRVCPLSIFLIYRHHCDQLLPYSLAFRVKPGVNLATTYIPIFLIQSI